MARTQLKPTTRKASKASKAFPTFGIKKVTKSKPPTKPRTPAQIDALIATLERDNRNMIEYQKIREEPAQTRPVTTSTSSLRAKTAELKPTDPSLVPMFERLKAIHKQKKVLKRKFEESEGTEYRQLPRLWRQAKYYDWIDDNFGLLSAHGEKPKEEQ